MINYKGIKQDIYIRTNSNTIPMNNNGLYGIHFTKIVIVILSTQNSSMYDGINELYSADYSDSDSGLMSRNSSFQSINDDGADDESRKGDTYERVLPLGVFEEGVGSTIVCSSFTELGLELQQIFTKHFERERQKNRQNSATNSSCRDVESDNDMKTYRYQPPLRVQQHKQIRNKRLRSIPGRAYADPKATENDEIIINQSMNRKLLDDKTYLYESKKKNITRDIIHERPRTIERRDERSEIRNHQRQSRKLINDEDIFHHNNQRIQSIPRNNHADSNTLKKKKTRNHLSERRENASYDKKTLCEDELRNKPNKRYPLKRRDHTDKFMKEKPNARGARAEFTRVKGMRGKTGRQDSKLNFPQTVEQHVQNNFVPNARMSLVTLLSTEISPTTYTRPMERRISTNVDIAPSRIREKSSHLEQRKLSIKKRTSLDQNKPISSNRGEREERKEYRFHDIKLEMPNVSSSLPNVGPLIGTMKNTVDKLLPSCKPTASGHEEQISTSPNGVEVISMKSNVNADNLDGFPLPDVSPLIGSMKSTVDKLLPSSSKPTTPDLKERISMSHNEVEVTSVKSDVDGDNLGDSTCNGSLPSSEIFDKKKQEYFEKLESIVCHPVTCMAIACIWLSL